MQDLIEMLRKQQRASAGDAPPALAERRAGFAPGGIPHPVPADVQVTAVTAGGVDVTLHVGEGLPHVYPIMLGTPEAAEATGQIGTFRRARVP